LRPQLFLFRHQNTLLSCIPPVRARLYLVRPIPAGCTCKTGAACRDNRCEVEPRTKRRVTRIRLLVTRN
jgi:hypothetical protein